MKKVISNTLLEKDKSNISNKPRLYYVKFYNELEMYFVGLTIQDCIVNHDLQFNIKRYHTIESWKDLLQKQKTILSTEVDKYKRTCITLPNFSCYYDEFANNYYVVNTTTGETITLK